MQHAQQEFGTVPHSFVFHRGRVGKNVRQLITDVRKVMEPYTARALKVSSGGAPPLPTVGGIGQILPPPQDKAEPGRRFGAGGNLKGSAALCRRCGRTIP